MKGACRIAWQVVSLGFGMVLTALGLLFLLFLPHLVGALLDIAP